jgi:1,4-dihydroxy-6-naphthoate synthase
LLSSGAALGHGCGPLLIARKLLTPEEVLQGPVALPGKWTTAHLLFKLFFPSASGKQFYPFHEIEEVLLEGKVAAGVIIHENRFTYANKGLVRITDLGEAWETLTGLPIPLGGIFVSKKMEVETIHLIEKLIRESILFARQNPDVVMPYVRRFAQEMDESVIWSHIDLYVNEFSLDLGDLGQKAVSQLKKMAP